MGPEFESPAGHQKEPSPFGDGSFWLPPQRFEGSNAVRMSTAAESLTGSDGSAAGGGRSDLSEWLRSVSDAGVRAKESTGHRNRGRTLILPSGKMQTNLRRVTPLKVAQTASYLEKSPSVLTNLISPQAKCKRISGGSRH